jgi:hypothetical protein
VPKIVPAEILGAGALARLVPGSLPRKLNTHVGCFPTCLRTSAIDLGNPRPALARVPLRQYDPILLATMHEAEIIKSSPQKLLAKGTDWRFFNELKEGAE